MWGRRIGNKWGKKMERGVCINQRGKKRQQRRKGDCGRASRDECKEGEEERERKKEER